MGKPVSSHNKAHIGKETVCIKQFKNKIKTATPIENLGNNHQCFLLGQIYKCTLAKGAKYSGGLQPSYHSPDKNILLQYLSGRQGHQFTLHQCKQLECSVFMPDILLQPDFYMPYTLSMQSAGDLPNSS